MTGQWVYCVLIYVAVIGAILLLIGGILVPIFKHQISTSKEVGNASFYFFNISNPDEIVKTGRNTIVNQVGPYVYRLTLELRDASFSHGHSRLSYALYKRYNFDESQSVGGGVYQITTVNLPILNLATRLLLTNETIERDISDLIERMNEGLFKTIFFIELVWGYKNNNVDKLTDFLRHDFGINLIEDTTFGLLYQSGLQPYMYQTTYEGLFEVSTIADETIDKWNVRKWEGKSSLDVWNSVKCNRINGTDGYAWPPDRDESETAYIFDSDWCRSIDLVITGSGSIDQQNSTTTHYEYSSDSFGYGGWRRGFCQPTPPGRQSSTCLRDGVLNVTKCKDNVPLLLSQPHFLNADRSYFDAIHGLNPDPKLHTTYFKIEQASGEVVEGSRKLQFNAYVMKLASFPDTKNFTYSGTVIPIAWIDEVYTMTEKEKELLLSLRKYYDEIQYSLIGIGAVLFIFAHVAIVIVFLLNRGRPEGERQPLLGQL